MEELIEVILDKEDIRQHQIGAAKYEIDRIEYGSKGQQYVVLHLATKSGVSIDNSLILEMAEKIRKSGGEGE